ncbi:tetratricopeptide repeat protein [Chryseolinea sp. H1M3-3]|uniref:tetratricopeptide repeat protein n=1 Tax=Chryseolinea sp. H1M3-3 TaxID=3034144 RepID=UPI0023EB91E2|nr:tetratricopeptide repeat protein [Chryseolinea sp. H1M3-3]
MIRFCLVIIVIAISLPCYPQEPTFINAAQVINRGKELYDSGKYKESIQQYLTIPKRDTAYINMLSEIALSYIAAEEFDKALASCQEGLRKTSPYRAHLLRSQAIATDRKGDYDKAVTLFTEAIEAYPTDAILVYNLGITHYNHKDYDKAISCFFRVLEMNPFHPGSHLNLGRISAGQGKKTHAMLSFGMYLGLANDDNERLVFMEKYVSNQFTEEGSLPTTNPNAFEKLDQIIRAKIAMDKNYKSKIDLDVALVKQYQMFFDQLGTASANTDDPWASYYLPVYQALKENEMVEPFIFHILKSANIELVKKWHHKNQKKLEGFYNVTNLSLKKKRELIVSPLLNFDKPTQAWYFANNRIEAIGNEDAQGKRKGKWIYFRQNYERSAEGTYADNGKKIGVWKYYNDDGTVSSIENSETGEVNVYHDGVLNQHFFLKNEKIHGKVQLFDACGTLNEILNYDRGRRHGPGKTLFANGNTKSTYTYDSNKVVGVFTNYFESGKIRNVLTYKADILEGRYAENHANGKLKSEGNYSNDQITGLWRYYHPNGRLESTGKYHEGKSAGEWTFYNERGVLIEKRNFDATGKFNGDNTIYHNGKVHYINNYKNDLLIGVVYLDTLGKQLGKFGHASGNFSAKQFYPTGQLSGEGAYKEGKIHGPWRYYFPEGTKHSEYVYENGLAQGAAVEYFKSGGKKYAFNYKDGKFDGGFQEFYPHGQLKQAGWFTDGDRQQQWLSYYPNGVLELDYYYLNGQLSGLCLDYNTTGTLSSLSEYKADQLEDIINYNSNGTAITQKTKQAGNVKFQTTYISGKQQTVFETTCGNYTKITKWFPDGKIFYAFSFLNGQKDGPYQYNAVTGKTLLQGNFINGQEEGWWKGFYENGKLDYEGAYLSGKHDSTWLYYFPNGQISSIAEFRNDERNGITRYFGPEGTPLLEKLYIEGHLVGFREITPTQAAKAWRPFTGNAQIIINYDNGKKAYEETYKNGVLTGPKRLYYQSGNLFSEYNYVLGDYDGEYRIHQADGRLIEKGTYKFDELHGVVEKYNDDGSLHLKEEYAMGSKNGKTVLFEKGQKKVEYEFFGGLPFETSMQ